MDKKSKAKSHADASAIAVQRRYRGILGRRAAFAGLKWVSANYSARCAAVDQAPARMEVMAEAAATRTIQAWFRG